MTAAQLTPVDRPVDRARRLRGQALSLLGAGDPASAREIANEAIDIEAPAAGRG